MDIFWLEIVLHHDAVLDNLGNSPPDNFPALDLEVKGLWSGGEVLIGKLLVLLSAMFEVFFVFGFLKHDRCFFLSAFALLVDGIHELGGYGDRIHCDLRLRVIAGAGIAAEEHLTKSQKQYYIHSSSPHF